MMRGIAAMLLLAAILGTAPLAATVQAPAASERISVERFAQLPFLANPVLSPDGTRIAAKITDGGAERIGIWTLSEGPDQRPRTVAGSNIQSYQWAGDDRLLVNVTNLFLLVGYAIVPIPVRRVVSHDLETGKSITLGAARGFVDEVIFVHPAGHYVLLSTQATMEATPSVVRIDLNTGESVEVQPRRHGVWSWFADGDGVVRVGVDYGERRTRIHYRAAANAPMRLIETRRNLLDNSVIDMVRFISDTERGIIVTNAETGRFGVYEYDFASDTRGAALFEHPEVDVTSAVIGRDGRVDGVFYEEERPRMQWLNPELARLQQRIDSTLAGKTNLIVNRSRDGNRVLIWSAAADDPGTYYVFDQAARRMEPFASPYDMLQGGSFAPVRAVSYQSRDGLRIPAYLTLPPGVPERGLPLVVLPHGGPFVRDSWAFNPEVQFLVSRGYAVLQPNFRGSTGYGRDFVQRGHGELGGAMIDDIDDGVDWLAREGIADGGRVCIMGSSYGGYAAIWGAMRSPRRYRCAISWAGPSDLRAMLRYNRRSFIPERYVREFRRQIEGEERTDLNAISPLRQAERLSVPVLIAHGEDDVTVPVSQSRDLVRALTRRGADVESVFYPKAGHGFTSAAEQADYLTRVEAFLERHNPSASPQTP